MTMMIYNGQEVSESLRNVYEDLSQEQEQTMQLIKNCYVGLVEWVGIFSPVKSFPVQGSILNAHY